MVDTETCFKCDRPVQGQRVICKICEAGTPPGDDNDGPPGAEKVGDGEEDEEDEVNGAVSMETTTGPDASLAPQTPNVPGHA